MQSLPEEGGRAREGVTETAGRDGRSERKGEEEKEDPPERKET